MSEEPRYLDDADLVQRFADERAVVYRDEILRRMRGDVWISTLDDLPRPIELVLATVYDAVTQRQEVWPVGLVQVGRWWCPQYDLNLDPKRFAVSHWMPMPKPAKRRKIELTEVSLVSDGTIDPAYRVTDENGE